MAKAQNVASVAVLQTGDEVKVYNGIEALRNAYNDAAETGSVITLSEGTFNSPGEIKKSVSIYGTGFEADAKHGISQPTIINGKLNYLTGSDEQSLERPRLEGIYVNNEVNVQQTKELTIAKCRIGNFNISGNNAEAITIRQSLIEGHIQGSNEIKGLDVENCYISYRVLANHADNQILINHCLLPTGSEGGHARAVYTNCIFNGLYRAGIATNSVVKNCILYGTGTDGCITEGNWVISDNDRANIFDDGKYLDNYYGSFYDGTRTYKLQDPETYVGTDGTEVGMCGGDYPWSKVPATPVVKNLKVEVDGMTLKVNYETEVR
ncbi:MAG: hypothetical protein IJM81_09240 [Prevotella sp.]|nr:hypothetical protein [Prevotella sp.]